MKKKYILALLLVFSTSIIFPQDRYKKQELSVLAKTWGFLKYYHPGIASGRHNWDSILVTSIDNIIVSKKKNQVTIELARLFEIAGANTAAAHFHREAAPIATRNYDISWIGKDKLLSQQQKQALRYTANHPYDGVNYYAQADPGNDSTVFTPNENPYRDMLFPNVNYRLLGLFRFWNVINYFYPYKYAIGEHWDLVLTRMIPLMMDVTDTISYHKALAQMSASINDSHGSLWPSVFGSLTGKYSPPFNFALIDGKAVVTKITDSVLCKQAKIQAGCVITSINKMSVKRRIRENLDYVPASNYGGKLKTMHLFILNTRDPQATYSGTDPDGKSFTTTIQQVQRNFIKDYLEFFEMTSPVITKIIEGNIGYMYLANINAQNLDSVMNSVLHTQAIIIDIRNYPNDGYVIYKLPEYFLSHPEIYARNTHPDYSLPGRFKYKIANNETNYSMVGKVNTNPYQGKIILLVDHRTQSAAEWACMALLTADRTIVIGNQTAGADGNVTRTKLPGNYNINFSGLGIYFPDGTETQRRGIPIDIKVKYTLQDIIHKNDPVLNKAIEIARQ